MEALVLVLTGIVLWITMHAILLIIGVIILWALLHRSSHHIASICRNCGSQTRSVTVGPRNFFIEIVLWFMGLVPGVLYSLWCNLVEYEACAKCRSRDIVPVDSPVGRSLAGSMSVHATPMSEQIGRK